MIPLSSLKHQKRYTVLCNDSEFRFQKTSDIVLIHPRLARRDVIELTRFHPGFELVHKAVQVIERVNYEKERLEMVDLKSLIDRLLDLDRISLHFLCIDGMRNLTMGAEQAAAVNF